MALLDLVDSFVGDLLKRNMYTDTNLYSGMVMKQPDNVEIPHEPTREEIYTESKSLNRSGPPLSLMDFHSNSVKIKGDLSKDGREPTPHPHFDTDVSSNSSEVIPTPSTPPGESPTYHRNDDLAPSQHGNASLTDLVSVHADIKNGTPAHTFAPPQGVIQDYPETRKGGNEYWDGGADLIRGGNYSLFPGEAGPASYFDPMVSAHWLRGIMRECYFVPSVQNDPITGETSTKITDETIAKSATWLASQFLLTAMNPAGPYANGLGNIVWNPLSLPLSAVPLVRATNATNITAGAALGDTHKDNYQVGGHDRHTMLRLGAYAKIPDGTMVSQGRLPDAGFRGELNKPGETATIETNGNLVGALVDTIGSLFAGNNPAGKLLSVREQVDTDAAAALGVHGNLYNADRPYNEQNAIYPLHELEDYVVNNKTVSIGEFQAPDVDVSKISVDMRFIPQKFPGGKIDDSSPLSWVAKPRLGSLGNDGFKTDELVDSPFFSDNWSVAFKKGQEKEGVATKLIEDKDLYMPFFFQDLRDTNLMQGGLFAGSHEKFLYFRAFLKSGITETFTPEWITERYYGRVDPVSIYQGTLRTFSLAFDIVAWSPQDLIVMWQKIHKLQSLVYPSYTSESYMKAGPMIRMRVGDLFASSNGRGLPGYLAAMDMSYGEIWNITTGLKVPRHVTVTLSYTVIHDGNPGIYPFQQTEQDRNDPNKPSKITEGTKFGVGKFGETKDKTKINVSPGELRKIFASVKKTTTKE